MGRMDGNHGDSKLLKLLLLLLVLSIGPAMAWPSKGSDAYVGEKTYSPRSQRADREFQYKVKPPGGTSAELNPKPNPNLKIFYERDQCAETCMVGCKVVNAQGDIHLFLCEKLRPPEKSLKDRLFTGASSWPWILFLGALAVSFLFCCGCLLWSCCCKRGNEREDGRRIRSHEPLATSDRRIEEIIPTQQQRPLLITSNGKSDSHSANNSSNNRMIGGETHVRLSTGSKYVVDV